MRSVILWLANVISIVTPRTRGFALRRGLFRAAGAKLAPDVKICGGVTMDSRFVEIGEGTWVGGGTRLIGTDGASVTIGCNCDIGPNVLLVTGSHELGTSQRRAGPGSSKAIW